MAQAEEVPAANAVVPPESPATSLRVVYNPPALAAPSLEGNPAETKSSAEEPAAQAEVSAQLALSPAPLALPSPPAAGPCAWSGDHIGTRTFGRMAVSTTSTLVR